jgi:hypothetical protein
MKRIAVVLAVFVAIASAQAIEGRNAISPDKTRTVPPDFHKVMDFYETGRRIRVYTLPIEDQDALSNLQIDRHEAFCAHSGLGTLPGKTGSLKCRPTS